MNTSLPTLALSIRQPWASFIIHGNKDIENRNWHTLFRGGVLIHASKRMTDVEFLAALDFVNERKIDCNVNPYFTLDRGGIVGVAEITDCVKQSDSPWFVGKYGFVLKNVKFLPFFPCKGALGFFKVDYPKELLNQNLCASASLREPNSAFRNPQSEIE